MCVKSLQSCPTPCDPVDCSLPGSSDHAILQARILEWVAISSPRGYSQLRDGTPVSCIPRGFFTTEPPRKPNYRAPLPNWTFFKFCIVAIWWPPVKHIYWVSELWTEPWNNSTGHFSNTTTIKWILINWNLNMPRWAVVTTPDNSAMSKTMLPLWLTFHDFCWEI